MGQYHPAVHFHHASCCSRALDFAMPLHAPAPAFATGGRSVDGRIQVAHSGLVAVGEGHAHGRHSTSQSQNGRHDGPDAVPGNERGCDDGHEAASLDLADIAGDSQNESTLQCKACN